MSYLGARSRQRKWTGEEALKVALDRLATVRSLVASGHRPAPEAVEAYLLTTGEPDSNGAERLRKFDEGLLGGKNFRDHVGRPM